MLRGCKARNTGAYLGKVGGSNEIPEDQPSLGPEQRKLMTMPDSNLQPDAAEARLYNRARRWVEIGDLVISFGFLIALVATGWSSTLRDLAVRMGRDHYILQ